MPRGAHPDGCRHNTQFVFRRRQVRAYALPSTRKGNIENVRLGDPECIAVNMP